MTVEKPQSFSDVSVKKPSEIEQKVLIREESDDFFAQLSVEETAQVAELVVNRKIVARALHKFRPHVPIQHFFELTDSCPVHQKGRRFAPQRNETVKRERDGMLMTEVATLTT